MAQLPQNKKQPMWPSVLILAIDWIFSVKYLHSFISGKMVWLPWNEKQKQNKQISWMIGLKYGHHFWLGPWPCPWIFMVRYLIHYISGKWPDSIKMTYEQTSLTYGYQFWLQPWPWPWIFKVKYFVGYMSRKMFNCLEKGTGPWFNIKMPSYRYRKSHCGDKTILRPSYLHNGISYTGKKTSLYWIRAQMTSSKPAPSHDLISSMRSSGITHIDGLVQDCSNSGAVAMELLQSCTKSSIWNTQNINQYNFFKKMIHLRWIIALFLGVNKFRCCEIAQNLSKHFERCVFIKIYQEKFDKCEYRKVLEDVIIHFIKSPLFI